MDRRTAQKIYYESAAAVAYIEVEDANGDLHMGTAFHVGDGVFVTARHCIADMKIREVRITHPVPVPSHELFPQIGAERCKEWDEELQQRLGFRPLYNHFLSPLELTSDTYFHDDENVDLAIFRVTNLHQAVPHIKLGLHWDDWVYRYPWVMTSALVLGYPPIPMTNEPMLVAARGDIHTFVIPRHSPHIHFILSSMPRGGFSGGPAIHEDGYALGVVTSSLNENYRPTELGFQAVLSIEPIRVLLEKKGLLPSCQAQYERKLMRIDDRPNDPAGPSGDSSPKP